ncbi:MAG: hypothetical protein ACTHK7_06000 [Aureliella sp.]
MHASQLAHVATCFASVGHLLALDDVRAVGDAAHGYWLANRFRCDAWHERIGAHRGAIERCGTSRRTRLWREITPVLQEILIAEPLTRIVAYLARFLEERGADADWGPLAHSTLGNHIEARHRCLNLMVFGYGLPVERAVALNRLRRLLEFFNDQLLAALPPQPELSLYAFEPDDVLCMQREFRRYSIAGPLQQVRLHSLSVSLDGLLKSDYQAWGVNRSLNESIAESALAMLPPEVFDTFGVVRGRLHATTAKPVPDAQVAIADLEQPLAAPFDLLMPTSMRQPSKAIRRF